MKTIVPPISQIPPVIAVYRLQCAQPTCKAILEMSRDEMFENEQYNRELYLSFVCPHCNNETSYPKEGISAFEVEPV